MTPQIADPEFPEKLQFLFEPHRYKVAYGGRGGAKSWGYARALLLLAAQRKMLILCARETQKSIADSVHRLLTNQIAMLGLGDTYTVQQASITAANGSEFIFAGLKHNIDSIKSLEDCDVCWVEEAQTMSKESWLKLVPTVRKAGSEIWVTFNPELETDETYIRFCLNPPPGAMVVNINFADNPWFPEVLRIERDDLRAKDEASYAHVYLGQCRSSVEGAVYEEEVKKAEAEKRITAVSCDRTRPVDTFWDLGFGDKSAIWFAQAVGGWYNIIDYLESAQHTIEWYLIQLQNRGYLYRNDWLPFDASDTIIHNKLAGGDKTRSIEMLMRVAGRKVRIAPKLHIHDGINAARTIFPQCRFDRDKCADGLMALRRYQWGKLNSQGVARREPLHDTWSHGADAFRTLAVAIRQPAEPEPPRKQQPPRPRATMYDWSG